MDKKNIVETLKKHQPSFHPLILSLKQSELMTLDFSEHSPYLKEVDLKDTAAFNELIFKKVLKGKIGIGGFFENRIIYRRSPHYEGAEPRSLHLGLDIWTKARTELYSPLAGKIYSVQDNQGFGDYGPTIILEHYLEDVHFYVLYGHLDHASLQGWQPRDQVAAGQLVGRIGDFPANGDWPPHLHWQIMTDMLGKIGDFPGVASPSEYDFYLQYCIDPHYLLTFAE